nr:6875_t:CDS:2 [Entrophospora candida]
MKVAGTDATKQFDDFHTLGTLEKYSSKLFIGKIGSGQIEEINQEAPSGEGSFGDLVPFGDPYWYQDFYSPYYNDSHRRVRAAVRKFVEVEIMPYVHEWDEAKKIPKELFVKAAKAGIVTGFVGAPWPKDYTDILPIGGIKAEEFDNFTEFIVGDELCRCGSGGVLSYIGSGLSIGLPPILNFGSEELKRRIAPECLNGQKIICLAVSEPHAGSDVTNLETKAMLTDDGDYYIVNGEKKWITNGMSADYFTTAVRTSRGISLLLIERTMPGIKTHEMQCSGVWSSGIAYVTFEDVKVPRNNIIGEENPTRFARVCYEEAMKYAHKRKTFGQKLINHAVIRNKLAHMARQIEATHAWIESLLYQQNQLPSDKTMERLEGPIALLKAQSTQTFEYCAREAVQIFGGLSYTRGGQGEKVERLYREVRAYAIQGGSEEIMLDFGVRHSLKVANLYDSNIIASCNSGNLPSIENYLAEWGKMSIGCFNDGNKINEAVIRLVGNGKDYEWKG